MGILDLAGSHHPLPAFPQLHHVLASPRQDHQGSFRSPLRSSVRVAPLLFVPSPRTHRSWDVGSWVHAKSLQSYLTLCDPINYSSPGSSVHGILQARILEWTAVPSCRERSRSGINRSLSPTLADRFFTTNATWEALLFSSPPFPGLRNISILDFGDGEGTGSLLHFLSK